MFSRDQRLSKTKDIEKVFSRGRRCYAFPITLIFLPNTLPVNRCTVVVSLKVSKKAVERNKVRRRIRAILQKYQPETKQGYDMIVLTSKEILSLSYSQMEKNVENLLMKAHLLGKK